MRTIFHAAGVAAILAASMVPAMAASPQCISVSDIKGQTIEDRGKAIVFQMRNGTYMRNTLKGSCPDLVFDGFVWTIHGGANQVCENMQSLRVLRSGEVCVLGKFEQVPKPVKPG